MKKILLGSLVILFALSLYFISGDSQEDIAYDEDAEELVEQSDDPVKTKVNNESKTPKEGDPNFKTPKREASIPVGGGSVKRTRPLSSQELEEMDKSFEKMEEQWDKEMATFFISDMSLSQQDYGDYLKMREGFEEDRLEAFEDFHERMSAKYGDSYRYSPTLDMQDFEGKLKKEYLDLFRRRYGEEAYVLYLNRLESFNDNLRRKSNPDEGILFIEF